CGHTYGTHSVWSMWDGKGKKLADQRTPWREAIELPGSAQVGHARRLIESRPPAGRIPDQSLLADHLGHGAEHCQAIRGADGSWAMIYSASGKPFTIALEKLTGKLLKPWWWDPRKGDAKAGEVFENKREPQEFLPPESGDNQDWVLVLDDAAKEYPAPGRR
ncbi:MAG TPA: putative collagen-binding domain-containing protein, partial [Chthoniobacteraceae bacterium]|nr:putative collagen-binding domain-containing protein [Chthoniobacteraceae bacterium]